MYEPRSSDIATSVPFAVVFRKRLFCASHWPTSSRSMSAADSRSVHSGSSILPRTASMTTTVRSSAEKIFLVERDRFQGRHGRVYAVDGNGERFRVHFDLRRPGIADHVALADLAHIAYGNYLPLEFQPLLDSGGVRGSRDEGDAGG